MKDQEIIIKINKGKITVNGVECNASNYNEVMQDAGIGEEEAIKLIKLIDSRLYEIKYLQWISKW